MERIEYVVLQLRSESLLLALTVCGAQVTENIMELKNRLNAERRRNSKREAHCKKRKMVYQYTLN